MYYRRRHHRISPFSRSSGLSPFGTTPALFTPIINGPVFSLYTAVCYWRTSSIHVQCTNRTYFYYYYYVQYGILSDWIQRFILPVRHNNTIYRSCYVIYCILSTLQQYNILIIYRAVGAIYRISCHIIDVISRKCVFTIAAIK